MDLFKKYQDEVVVLGYDFANEMNSGESLISTNSTITIYDSNDNEVTSTLLETGSTIVDSSTILQGAFKDGTAGEFYTVVFFGYIEATKQLIGRITIEVI